MNDFPIYTMAQVQEPPAVDTIRILVDWKCNLSCSYCCNDQERFRKDIRPVKLESIDFGKYQTVCISGGEPLLFPNRIKAVCDRIPLDAFCVLYTNGIFLDQAMAKQLERWGVEAINVGLHVELTFDLLIRNISGLQTFLKIRFHAQDIYRDRLTAAYPAASFRFWKMDDCDRDNEERVVLSW